MAADFSTKLVWRMKNNKRTKLLIWFSPSKKKGGFGAIQRCIIQDWKKTSFELAGKVAAGRGNETLWETGEKKNNIYRIYRPSDVSKRVEGNMSKRPSSFRKLYALMPNGDITRFPIAFKKA